ncbi:MAG: C4-dicarboxylate ABC transporter permease [Burkholderiales bacterium RIFOXYC2_FULL_59_8]|nr:MAG: C4-dicarboxylate ABC transporter permease [Burkholderiales bacterium RIFOXYC2_FULL_59_8]OGB54493.1 MAG: C4-dicarboxylate ABC transporter permease [Burkholderiales bacterium RIFOXYD12_FULL_59_19]OGB66184.1 MAG: C4-dicarboxylate ABC transporter permease [Burkholderiales bacterium RIFOXYC12_FULL_60_6]
MFKLIQKIDQSLAKAEQVLVVILTAGIASIMMSQVVMRYFFSAPIFWAEEISVQLLVFVTLFGLSLLVQRVQLVTIDFLPRALPGRARHALLAVLGLVMLCLLVFVAKLGWEWINRADVRLELGATTQLPRWYNFSALPLAFGVMAFHQFAAILRDLRAVTGVSK